MANLPDVSIVITSDPPYSQRNPMEQLTRKTKLATRIVDEIHAQLNTICDALRPGSGCDEYSVFFTDEEGVLTSVTFSHMEVSTWRSSILPKLIRMLESAPDSFSSVITANGHTYAGRHSSLVNVDEACVKSYLRGLCLYQDSKAWLTRTIEPAKTETKPDPAPSPAPEAEAEAAPAPVINTCSQCLGFDQRGCVNGLCCYCFKRSQDTGEDLRRLPAPALGQAGHDYGEQWASPSWES